MLAIRPFRRLLASAYLCSVGDWLGFLALSGLASQLMHGYFAQNFAFSGVVLTNLLPGLIFAPIGGVLADRFDRRKVMVFTDLARCALFVSIPFVGTVWWLFVANFLVGCMAMLWIPAKESSVPNLMRRPEQIETANQVGLVMTYGCAVLTGATLYAVISGFGSTLHLSDSAYGIASVIVLCNGVLYALSAMVIWTRIPEISAISPGIRMSPPEREGFFRMLREGMRIAGRTPLIRGLLLGMTGAFAAAGAVIGTAREYAQSLLGGESVLGVLFMTLFLGLATGMVLAPKLARRMVHNRLFGVSIVVAGLALAVAGVSPHLIMAMVAVYLVGGSAGVAFLTGITIIGTQVDDAVRGRVNSVYQALMKIVLFASTIVVPLLVGVIARHTYEVLGRTMTVDGTRPVLFGAGLIAAASGVLAYRQMGDRSTESIMATLVRVARGHRERTAGVLVAVEGGDQRQLAEQSERIADWLRAAGRDVLVAGDPGADRRRLADAVQAAQLTGSRATALVAAAIRADLVEHQVRPALAAGATVVLTRHPDAGTDFDDPAPDLTVLLEDSPATEGFSDVRTVLAELAVADPARYLVLDAETPADAITAQVVARLAELFPVSGTRRQTAGAS